MKKARVVICDDEMLIRVWLAERLSEAGLVTEDVADGECLLDALGREPADLVLLDLRLPGASGLELLPRIKALDATLPVIMMTAYGEVETAVAAVRAGAHHFLEKPINPPELLLMIEQALEARELRSEIERFRDGFRWQFADVSLVGRSPAMRKIAELITRLGAKGSTMNVLLRGESGTGKDVVARAIHAQGPRHTQPFVSVNCTSLPEQLVESELFGHEPGAYTDAREVKRGLFEIAHHGTVFLDEIGDVPKAMQAKLLHFLETYEFRRVGGLRNIEVDVHVITATNRDLEAAVSDGNFREDLFYRLNVVPIVIPPLRERPEDIGPLAMHFVELLCLDLSQPVRQVTKEALRTLEAYSWPGNARELRNVIERVLLLEDSDAIQAEHLPAEIRGNGARNPKSMILPANGLELEELERDLICQALARAEGNKTGAARLLGLSRDTLRYRLEKYGIH
jgi:two-component system response regulator AtoC